MIFNYIHSMLFEKTDILEHRVNTLLPLQAFQLKKQQQQKIRREKRRGGGTLDTSKWLFLLLSNEIYVRVRVPNSDWLIFKPSTFSSTTVPPLKRQKVLNIE